MIFADDEMVFPQNGKKSLDLQNLSVQDLEDRIVFLEAEIARARAMIAEKRSHRADIESLFNTGE